MEGLLLRFASSLNEKGRKLEAVELYRRANRPTDAALLINEIAEHVARRDVKPSLAKRLQVLSAHEIERHRKRTLDAATKATLQGDGTGGATKNNIALATAATLETLMMTSLDTQTTGLATMTTAQGGRKTSRAFGSAWRAAAAYHYHMLAQKQYYAGNMDAAMKTAIKLCEYDDILSPRDIYSLLALTAFSNKFFAICSQAFVKVGDSDSVVVRCFRSTLMICANALSWRPWRTSPRTSETRSRRWPSRCSSATRPRTPSSCPRCTPAA